MLDTTMVSVFAVRKLIKADVHGDSHQLLVKSTLYLKFIIDKSRYKDIKRRWDY